MVQVISIAPALEPILGFLHPTYSYTEGLTKFRDFITHYDVKSSHERELLNHKYENGVIISTRIFDELYTAETMATEVLAFAQKHFGSRKRTFKFQSVDPAEQVNECLRFLFTGATEAAEESTQLDRVFRAYGSKTFYREFLSFCLVDGAHRARAALETFITKVLQDTSTIYYQRARVRLLTALQQNLDGAVEEVRSIDPHFVKKHGDLVALRLFTLLMKKEYYG